MNGTMESKQPDLMGEERDRSHGLGRKIKRALERAVLWSYERGSWQYDIMVLVILAYIFLTPRLWFHDGPRLELSDVRHVPGIVQVSHRQADWVYLVDARLVKPSGAVPMDQLMRQILARRVPGQFTLRSVAPLRDKSGVVLGYTVIVSRP